MFENVSRRGFVGGVGFAGAGAMLAPQLVEVAWASNSEEVASLGINEHIKDELFDDLLDETPVTEDLTLPNGSVVPAVYVALRNRLNRIASGVGSMPNEHSYEKIMQLWSEEDAAHELEMPLHRFFTATDYSVLTGRSIEACAVILDDMSSRCLIVHVVRGGVSFYYVSAWVFGTWEISAEKFTPELVSMGVYSDAASKGPSYSPGVHSVPVSKDVVEGGVLPPYHDWEQIIKNNEFIIVAPCTCRYSKDLLGVRPCDDGAHPTETCMCTGEWAQWCLECGHGRQITQEEALEIGHTCVDKGMVPEPNYSKAGEFICFCGGDCCNNLSMFRAANGAVNQMPLVSAYRLKYDGEACVKCGACIERCPMKSVSFGEDGLCVLDEACVACGQCVLTCPAGARILVPKDDYPELPDNIYDDWKEEAHKRLANGYITDFTGTSLE